MYPTANNISYGGEGKVSKDGVDRMVADLEKQWVDSGDTDQSYLNYAKEKDTIFHSPLC